MLEKIRIVREAPAQQCSRAEEHSVSIVFDLCLPYASLPSFEWYSSFSIAVPLCRVCLSARLAFDWSHMPQEART